MLIEFSVSNFRSILARQTLSLVASSGKEHVARNVARREVDIDRVLRSAVIYGPNAAGKSNLLLALRTVHQLVLNSATQLQEGQTIDVTPFRLQESSSRAPSEFSLVFIADDGVRYEYACAISAQRVHREWLVAYPRGRPQRWFEREYHEDTGKYSWWFGPHFSGDRAEKKVWREFTRSNALFFSTAIQLNNEQLKAAFTWFQQRLIVLAPGIQFNPFLSLEMLRQPAGREEIIQYLRAADIGIADLEVREEEISSQLPLNLPQGSAVNIIQLQGGAGVQSQKVLRVMTWHKRADGDDRVQFDMSDESDGTRKLFEFAGGWLRALSTGATLFVDELDRSLHPHITRFLVQLFHGASNPKNAQLVFTTHDTTLLDTSLLRRDQVWFVEKTPEQASHIYSLLEYTPRKDEALERGYLKGRYGAVPTVGNIIR